MSATQPSVSRPGRSGASTRVGAGIFLSRIAGLVRERVFAHYFGSSPIADAWRAAIRMPNVLQNLLGEGTLSASFIPIYAELLEEKREAEAARFAGAIFGVLTLVAGLLALAGVLLAPLLVAVFFAGFEAARQEMTVALVRILFPMAALLATSAWALGVLNSHRRFFVSYVAPVVWNIAMIAAMLGGALIWGLDGEALVMLLAWGAFAGGALQLGVQLPLTLKLLGEFKPTLSTRVHGVKEAIQNFIPVLAARGAVNLSGWLDYTLASFLAIGAVATLGYAQILYMLPISLFGMSVAASELPELSRGRGRAADALAADVSAAMERVLFFLIPASFAYVVLGDVIVSALYRTGAFGTPEVAVTWAVLAAYAIGMPASALSRLLSSSFYALRDTRTPARVAYFRVALSLSVGLALMFPLDRVTVGPLRLGAAGLALGATAAAWIELTLLRKALAKAVGAHGVSGARVARIVAAAGMGAGAGIAVLPFVRVLRPWVESAGTLLPFTGGLYPWVEALGTLLPFGGVYLAATLALGVADPIRGLLPGRSAGS